MSKFRHQLLKYLPARWRHKAVELKNKIWGGWRHHYYSHCGEDVFVDSYFRNKKQGFYVDVGAHHPKRYSNTALLYERGWYGINIEPNSHAIKLFSKQRSRDINIHYGVGEREDVAEFHKFSDPAVNTFSMENSVRLKNKKWLTEVSVEKVRIRPLSAILDEFLPINTKIDFLDIDVEDLDIEVLRSNNWQKFRATLVAVEDRFFDILNPPNSPIYKYLLGQNYVYMAKIGLTLIFVDKETLSNNGA